MKYKLPKEYYLFGVILLFFTYNLEFGKNYDIKQMPMCREFRFIKDYLENNHKSKNSYIIIYQKPVLFTTLGYSSINFKVLKKYKDNLIDYFKQRNCQYFLAIQLMDTQTGEPIIGEELPNNFTLEKLLEQKLENNYYLKISKCFPEY